MRKTVATTEEKKEFPLTNKTIKDFGITIFEKEIKLDAVRYELVRLQNAWLVNFSYLEVGKNQWYIKSYSLKSHEEIETFILSATKYLV